ncbi:MAG: hypothetical protein PVH77_04320 [Phycisphaerales bacterium]|jgi:hypothetical protein
MCFSEAAGRAEKHKRWEFESTHLDEILLDVMTDIKERMNTKHIVNLFALTV